MVRHIVIWKLKDEFTPDEKREYSAQIKFRLEALTGIIPEIKSLEVITELLPGSANADLMLDGLFEDEQALNHYQSHPEHQKVSDFVGTLRQSRVCVDYQVTGNN